MDFVLVVLLAESAYFSWMRAFSGDTPMGNPSQQLPEGSRTYAVLMVWSSGITEDGSGVWGSLVSAYVTV